MVFVRCHGVSDVVCACVRDDLVVPRSPYFPVESAAGQERGPSPMVMERFQSVASQLFQHVQWHCILYKCLVFLLDGFYWIVL